MFESDSVLSKSEYDDYKVNISNVFKPVKPVFREAYSNNTKLITENNNNNNYNRSIANSNTFSYLYPDRTSSNTLSAMSLNNRNTSSSIRRKSYNLQKQRTIKNNILHDPFWGFLPEKKTQPVATKLHTETKALPETVIVQKIIEKIEKETIELPSNTGVPSLPSTALHVVSSIPEKRSARLEKIDDELTERLFSKIEKEKTNFSIKLAYEDLFDRKNNLSNRDVNATPHAYLRLNSANNVNNKEKLIEIDDRISLNPTPDTYQNLENPGSINLYTELNAVCEPIENHTKKSSFPRKRFKNPYQISSRNSNKTSYNNNEILANTESDAYNLNQKDNIYEVDKLAESIECNLNTDSFILKKVNTKRPLHALTNSRRLSTIRTFNTKGQSNKLSKPVKEFKNCIITDLKIGEGEFSETFQGYRYDDGIPSKIAAKRLKKLKEKGNNIVNLFSEISVLTQLGSHPNIIEYLGIHTFENNIYMVFEFAEKGDLKKQLELCRKNLKVENANIYLNKIKIAYDIANGMEYISSLDIVHKDLAARNMLLDRDSNCKIADFGCCKADFLTRRPIRWMAPESISKLLFTTASDVWSFGVVLWEIWTYGMTPYPGMTDDEVVNRVSRWYRLYRPSECPDEVYSLMQSCWKEYSKARPRFQFIKKKLKELYENRSE